VNLFAFRTTDPKALYAAARDGVDIVGDRNDEAIRQGSGEAVCTIVAWGAHGPLLSRSAAVVRLLDHPLCLGLTGRGEPRHPLYVAQATEPVPYEALI